MNLWSKAERDADGNIRLVPKYVEDFPPEQKVEMTEDDRERFFGKIEQIQRECFLAIESVKTNA